MGYVKRKWTVEHSWTCASCKHVNRGRDLTCVSCGKPKGGERYEGDATALPAVTDAKTLRESKRGANWSCAYCKYENRGDESKCGKCGADIFAGTLGDIAEPPQKAPPPQPREEWDRLREKLQAPLPPLPPPNVTYEGGDYRTAPRVVVREQLKVAPDVPVPSSLVRSLVRRAALTAIVILGSWQVWIGLGLFLVCGGLTWLFVPHEEHVTVAARTWSRTASVQQRQTLHRASWDDEEPGSAFNISCETRQHGTHSCDPYDCNPHSESYSCDCHSVSDGESCSTHCTSGENGFSECEEYCSPRSHTECDTCSRTVYDTCWHQCPTYDQWCAYDYYEWPTIASRRTQGQGEDTVVWPDLQADPNAPSPQRLVREEQYAVRFTHDERAWSYAPTSEPDYQRFHMGAHWTVSVTRVGNVGFTPLREER